MPAHLAKTELGAGPRPLLSVGPWQEYTLSMLLVQAHGHVAQRSRPPSPVGSYSSVSSRGSTIESRSPWTPLEESPVTALFRHARNLKYNGPRYERPWRAKVRKAGTGGAVEPEPQVREIRVARLQTMYGFGNKQQEQDHHLKQQLE